MVTIAHTQPPSDIWDTTLDGGVSDWQILEGDSSLYSGQQLHSSVILQLFTNSRSYDDDILPSGSNRQGWWGNTVGVDTELGQGEIGSRLWLYTRSVLTNSVVEDIKRECERSLQIFVTQGVVASVVVEANADITNGCVVISIQLLSDDGIAIYNKKFQRYWGQLV